MPVAAGRRRTPAVGARAGRALEALGRLATGGHGEHDFFAGLGAILAEVAGAGRVLVWRLSPDGMLHAQAPGHNVPASIVEALEPVPCQRVVDRLVFDRERLAPGAEGALLLPWTAGDEALGVIAVSEPARAGGFSEDDVAALQLAAVPAAMACQQWRLRALVRAADAEEARRVAEHVRHLSDVERVKNEILNLAAHELRGPITALRGYLSMIEMGDIPDIDGVRHVLPVLLTKTDEVATVVERMLATARVNEGHLSLDVARIDLRRPVRAAAEQMRMESRDGHWVVLEMDPHPVWVLGDIDHLTTVVGNLVGNAIKYSPEGGEIRCSVRCEGGEAVVRVVDRGLGIAAADVPRLFTRFGRVITDENSAISGVGLGLYFCRELVRLHGGSIDVESTPGAGSTFWFSLPLHEEDVAELPAGPFGLETLTLPQLFSCCRRLRDVRGATEEERGRAMLSYLSEHLLTGEGEPACALLRLFKVEPYRSLPPALQAPFTAGAAGFEPRADTAFVRLLASVGSASRSNDAAMDTRRWFRASPVWEAAEASPVLDWMLEERRQRVRREVEGERPADVADGEGIKGLLYVDNPAGHELVPDQEFVRRSGIRSVIGCAEMLPRGHAFGFVLYSRVPIPPPVAQLLRGVGYSMRLTLLAAGEGSSS